ncbi:hypothetical protein [Serratia oryzae]|uniref:Lysozyme inhibitor LprI N-terminal domain-containing protein n=1 Tax=Serratia oryzae TaxID=2034155 RepID=A0A1S8CLM6_9GAMM|nr:hypothetical protein [Serratia oryzae]OMQ24599.1 hypothetical protein BMI79_07185 [Serratia oryzae]
MTKKIILSFLLLLSFFVSANGDNSETRMVLKKWGMAYCLEIYQKTESADEAGSARSGYFQLGEHSEQAYKNVKNYFNRVIPEDKRVMQATGKPNNLMRCLDVYESLEYEKVIRAQDKWIGTGME